jgi:hypothetical protein
VKPRGAAFAVLSTIMVEVPTFSLMIIPLKPFFKKLKKEV